MESVILELTKQLLSLTTENATLKSELAKYQVLQVLPEIVPKSRGKYVKKIKETDSETVLETIPPKPKHPGHVAAGKKLAAWNATKKGNFNEFLEAAQLEW